MTAGHICQKPRPNVFCRRDPGPGTSQQDFSLLARELGPFTENPSGSLHRIRTQVTRGSETPLYAKPPFYSTVATQGLSKGEGFGANVSSIRSKLMPVRPLSSSSFTSNAHLRQKAQLF